jgi:hypothetical protein
VSIDEEDEEESVRIKCPFCRGMVPVYNVGAWCKHVAFAYIPTEGVLEEGPAGKGRKFAKWLVKNKAEDNLSRYKFGLFRREFKLKCRSVTVDGMACGPMSAETMLAFVELPNKK